jgi:hypothetical protein
VASPDGERLYAAGRDGLTVVATHDLTVLRHDVAGLAIDALAVTIDGTAIFGVVHGTGRIVAIDAATGDVLGMVPGDGYDRLLATAPW